MTGGAANSDEGRQAMRAGLTDAPCTAPTSKRLSRTHSEQLGFEGRPRSWSEQGGANLRERPPNRLTPTTSHSGLKRSSTLGGESPPMTPVVASSGAAPVAIRTQHTAGQRRPASVYSKGGDGVGSDGRSFDGQASRSQPRVATMAAGNGHPVMARGQIVVQPSKPRLVSSSGMPASMRKQALAMMKPFAAADASGSESIDCPTGGQAGNLQPRLESAAASATVSCGISSIAGASGSAAQSGSSCNSSRRGSCNSVVASDPEAAVGLLTNPRQRLGSRAGAVVAASSIPSTPSRANAMPVPPPPSSPLPLSSAENSPSQGVVWTTYSWLKRRASVTLDSQPKPDSSAISRDSAASRLKDIKAKQHEQLQTQYAPEELSVTSGCLHEPFIEEASGEPDETVGSESQPALGQGDVDSCADPASLPRNIGEAGTLWHWWWLGAKRSTPAGPSRSDSGPEPVGTGSQPSVHTDNLHDQPQAIVEQQQPGDLVNVAAASDDARVASSSQPLRANMLIPDLDFGCSAGTNCSSNESIGNGTIKLTNGEVPADISKPSFIARVRLFGHATLQRMIEMTPDWLRLAIQGRAAADVLGQLDDGPRRSSAVGSSPNARNVKDAVDVGARKLGKIAVIGVHGWFPTRMVQMFSGEPTGKSEKFCVMMRDALKEYLQESHGVDIQTSDISLFPLVGEGRIEDRVELLLSQITDAEDPPAQQQPANGRKRSSDSSRPASGLDVASPAADSKANPQTNARTPTSSSSDASIQAAKQSAMIAEVLMPERKRRAETLKAADTVFVVTHSQGAPVSAMLIERMIELELIDPHRQRVGMLAMAGISHGPLPYLKDNVVIRYIESEAARELFELMDPSSPQSQRYVGALSTILHKGVRLICIGSWVDEVVPLYSAIIQGVSHPNVYRAMHVDSHHYLDDFLTNLIVFALRLRNMGIYDHDLLIHLSEVVAGSLWGHSGHSTIYAEPAVYKLAIKWLLYSTSSVHLSPSASVPTTTLGLSLDRQHASASGLQTHMSYRPFNATDRLNPFFIPWIMRTLWDEPEIRQNESLRVELRRLVALFDKWAPDTKAGKELKYRLEPVRAAM